MISPELALEGIQKAVKLIKQASKTVDDVASLGPLLGKYFNAKSEATKAVASAKKGGSSMGMAIEIEMALEAGADTFVVGSAVFNAPDPAAMVVSLREYATAHGNK